MTATPLHLDKGVVRVYSYTQERDDLLIPQFVDRRYSSRDAGAVPKPVLLGGSTYPHSLRTERATADGLMAVAAELVPACALGPFQFSRAKGIGTVERSMNHSQSKAKLD